MIINKIKCICGEDGTKICSKCKAKRYCSVICQRNDWKNHKKKCSVSSSLNIESLMYYYKKGIKYGIKNISTPKTLAGTQKNMANK